MNRMNVALFGTLVALVGAMLGSMGSNAQAGLLPPFDFCRLMQADASVTLDASHPYHALTSGFAYWAKTNGCARFVVDVWVPGLEIGQPPDFRLAGLPPQIPQDAASCTATATTVTVYRRGFGETDFTPIAGGTAVGTWPPDHGACALSLVQGDPTNWWYDGYAYWVYRQAGLAPFGGATYRIAAVRKMNTIYGLLPNAVSIVAKGWGSGGP